jgi:hypothetical protein
MAYLRRSKATATKSISTAQMQDDAVTLAKMAGGTDGEVITYDASGDPAVVAVGTSGHYLKSGGAGVAPAFGAVGRPAFSAYSSSTQTLMPQNSFHLIKCNSEHFDSDGAYDTGADSDFTCPAGKGGYYLFQAQCRFEAWSGPNSIHDAYAIELRVNGTNKAKAQINQEPDINTNGVGLTAILQIAAGEVVAVYAMSEQGSGSGKFIGLDYHTRFSGTFLGTSA